MTLLWLLEHDRRKAARSGDLEATCTAAAREIEALYAEIRRLKDRAAEREAQFNSDILDAGDTSYAEGRREALAEAQGERYTENREALSALANRTGEQS